MRGLDWKSGPTPGRGWYLIKDDGEEDYEAGVLWQDESKDIWDWWIGPLALPEKAPEPPAPDWGRGPVPAAGDYVVIYGTPELRSYTKGHTPRPGDGDWYGPIPDRPAPAEEPTEVSEWSELAKYGRCIFRPHGGRCIFVAGHAGDCRGANGIAL